MPPPSQSKLVIDAILDFKKTAESVQDPKFQRALKDLHTRSVNLFTQFQKQHPSQAVREHGLLGQVFFGPQGPQGLARQVTATVKQIQSTGLGGLSRIPLAGPILGGVFGAPGAMLGGARGGGLLGGATGLAGALGPAAVATAVGGLFTSLFRGFTLNREMLQASGGLGSFGGPLGIRGGPRQARMLSTAGRRLGFAAEEMLGFGTHLARATGVGDRDTAQTIAAAQRMFGAAPEAMALLGGAARRGERTQGQAAAKMVGDVIGAAMAAKLEKGRIGEAIIGTHEIMESLPLGMKADQMAISGLHATLGGGSRGLFAGTPGFQAMRGLDALARGGGTPVGRAMAMLSAGLGDQGVSFPEVMKRMEGGLFGAARPGQTQAGLPRLQALRSRFEQMGAPREYQEMFMAQAAGVPISSMEKILDALDKGTLSQEELKKMQEEAKPTVEKAAQTVVDMFPTVRNIETILNQLSNVGDLIINSQFIQKVTKFAELGMSFIEKTAGSTGKPISQQAAGFAGFVAGRSAAIQETAASWLQTRIREGDDRSRVGRFSKLEQEHLGGLAGVQTEVMRRAQTGEGRAIEPGKIEIEYAGVHFIVETTVTAKDAPSAKAKHVAKGGQHSNRRNQANAPVPQGPVIPWMDE